MRVNNTYVHYFLAGAAKGACGAGDTGDRGEVHYMCRLPKSW